jgi:hypothetical protein
MSEHAILINDPEVFNRELLAALTGPGDDATLTKKASQVATQAIKRRLRETGWMREILPMKPLPASELGRYPAEEDNLFTVDEMEPDQPGAVSLPLNDSHRTHYFRGQGFITRFFKIATPEWVKNVHELAVYKKIDLQKVIVDNSLKDMMTHEDTRFIGWIDAILGAAGGANGAAGVQQNFDYSAGGLDEPASTGGNGVSITRENFRRFTLSHLEDRELNNGIFLVNRKTAKEHLGWGRDEVGGDKAQELLFKGNAALEKLELFGVPILSTMKRDLIADGEVYQFAEPDYLGKAYSLKDVTMYVERKKDLIRISAEEIIGVSIANVAAVNKVTFEV